MTAANVLFYRPPRAEALPTEPFGQAGLRQYAGRVVAWVCLTLSLSALAMGHRSQSFADVLDWGGKNEGLRIISGDGRLLINHNSYANRSPGQAGWKYTGGYSRWWARRAPAVQSGLGALGIEAEASPLAGGAETGVWVRVAWPLIAAVFMVQPVAYVVRRAVRRYRRTA